MCAHASQVTLGCPTNAALLEVVVASFQSVRSRSSIRPCGVRNDAKNVKHKIGRELACAGLPCISVLLKSEQNHKCQAHHQRRPGRFGKSEIFAACWGFHLCPGPKMAHVLSWWPWKSRLRVARAICNKTEVVLRVGLAPCTWKEGIRRPPQKRRLLSSRLCATAT